MNTELKKPVSIERTTTGLRNLLFDKLECYLRGEITAEQLTQVRKTSAGIMQIVEKDLLAQRQVAELRRGLDQPQCVADLNLNLRLGGSIIKSITDVANAPPQGPRTTFVGGKSPTLPSP